MRMRRLINQAIRQSDLSAAQKLRLRLTLALSPGSAAAVEAIEDFVVAGRGEIGTAADGELIKFLIEHLPEILAIIEQIIGLFG